MLFRLMPTYGEVVHPRNTNGCEPEQIHHRVLGLVRVYRTEEELKRRQEGQWKAGQDRAGNKDPAEQGVLKVGPPRSKKAAAAAATGVAGTIRRPKNEKGVDDLPGRKEPPPSQKHVRMQAPPSSSSDEEHNEEEEHVVRIKQELRKAGTLWETYPSDDNERERTKELRAEKKGKVAARGREKRTEKSRVLEDRLRDESEREGSSTESETTVRVKRKLEPVDHQVSDDDDDDNDKDNNDHLPQLFDHPCEACFKDRRYCVRVKAKGINVCALCYQRKGKCTQIEMRKQMLAQAPSGSRIRGKGASRASKGTRRARSVSIRRRTDGSESDMDAAADIAATPRGRSRPRVEGEKSVSKDGPATPRCSQRSSSRVAQMVDDPLQKMKEGE